MSTKHLLSGHARFRRDYFTSEREFLRNLATEGQRPSSLYIGCSDSRVVPELLTSSKPGELFVIRNIANLVPELRDPAKSVAAACEYAIEVLGVQNVIVCGHDGCGGVKAAVDNLAGLEKLTALCEWLDEALPAGKMVNALGLTGDEAMRVAVEENVLNQMDNLIEYPAVARALAEHRLQLHGWVFDIATGAIRVYDVESETYVPASEIAG